MHRTAVAAWAGRSAACWLALWAIGGCATDDRPAAATLFAPASMRIHPIFTQMVDLGGEGRPDGIEAQLEFDDQFGDPTKAAGRVLFELYEYRRQPPFTGRRVGGPYLSALATPAEQRALWNKTLRTYRFPLAFPGLVPTQDYILTAVFQRADGGRFFDKRVITGRRGPARPATAVDGPATSGPAAAGS